MTSNLPAPDAEAQASTHANGLIASLRADLARAQEARQGLTEEANRFRATAVQLSDCGAEDGEPCRVNPTQASCVSCLIDEVVRLEREKRALLGDDWIRKAAIECEEFVEKHSSWVWRDFVRILQEKRKEAIERA